MELFNYKHFSLCNIIERCFGVLKARFPVSKVMPNYHPRRQICIPIACCVLHNFIRNEACRDRMFEQFEVENMIFAEKQERTTYINMSSRNLAQMSIIRDKIAEDLWCDYTHNM